MTLLATTSQSSVYNMALGHIGVAPVTSITEASSAATVCNMFWDAAVRDTLRSASWDFATTFVTLTQSSTYTILNNWAYAYEYPSDCIKLWDVISPDARDRVRGITYKSAKFQVRYDSINNSKVILTDVADAIAEYTVPVSDVSLFDSTFIKVCSLMLASYICTPLVNDDQKTAAMIKLFNNALSDAQRLNDDESNMDKNDMSSAFLDARGGGGPVSPMFHSSPSTSQF